MKRLYRTVGTQPVVGGHAIRVDDKSLKTPGHRDMVVPTIALAGAIVAEWDAQQDEIRPATMPLTQLAATALDRMARERGKIVADVAAYGHTDLLCYRADHPPPLAARQHAAWQPLLDWAALRYDAPLRVTTGIIPTEQPPASLRALEAAVAALDDFRLTALMVVTPTCGSLIIGLALLDGRIDADAAFAASQLEETFQIEAWGSDAEAETRRDALAAEIVATARFLALLSLDPA